MPEGYEPDAAAQPIPPWSTAFLSQRDLSLQVPINFVTYPGVSVTSACFGNNVYDTSAASLCFSNLFAVGFRRFVLDLFWDDGRKVWSFCPVQVPNSASDGNTSISSTQSLTTSPSVSISGGQISPGTLVVRASERKLSPDTTPPNAPVQELELRQPTSTVGGGSTSETSNDFISTTVSTSSAGSSANISASDSTTSPTPVVSPSNGASLYQIGSYKCTSTIDLPIFTGILSQYLQNTSTTLAAFLTYLEFNLHAASSLTTPLSPAPALNSSTDPPPGDLLTNVLNVNLSSFLYTPAMLRNDRANLNASWFSDTREAAQTVEYFNITLNSDNVLTTQNGWPSESYIEFSKQYRLIVGYGSMDPQLATYNFTGDENTIFAQNAFTAAQTVAYGTAGLVEEGCFNDTTTIATSNNSWAVTTSLQIPLGTTFTSNDTLSSLSNLTSCGISPLLNDTLSNTTADQTITPYQSIAYNSIWSWFTGEPRNVSSLEPNSNLIRCALLDKTLGGRWRVADCTEKHFAACRTSNAPYVWLLSSSRGTYSSSSNSCPDGTSFVAPRTGLENVHLFAVALQHPTGDNSDMGFWINFNTLDVEGCWVSGVNASCPYTESRDRTNRTVVIPTVAAVIVFLIAVLTLFVKCASNRQTSRRRRRRRGNDGWDYEGVPS